MFNPKATLVLITPLLPAVLKHRATVSRLPPAFMNELLLDVPCVCGICRHVLATELRRRAGIYWLREMKIFVVGLFWFFFLKFANSYVKFLRNLPFQAHKPF